MKAASEALRSATFALAFVCNSPAHAHASLLTSSGCPAGNGEQWREDEAVAGVRYKSTDANIHDACAALTLVCDGMYSSLRAKLSVPNIQHPSYFVGLVLRGCALPWPNYGHVILARPSPILFYPISSTEVSCRLRDNYFLPPACQLPLVWLSFVAPLARTWSASFPARHAHQV